MASEIGVEMPTLILDFGPEMLRPGTLFLRVPGRTFRQHIFGPLVAAKGQLVRLARIWRTFSQATTPL